MDEGNSSRPTDTPEGSVGDDGQATSTSKTPAVKDRKCQYCHQAFTSSSLGRHLDQFLFKKKPDGVHDVEEIRRIRSGITRRQARTSSSKHDSPERAIGKGQTDGSSAGEIGSKPPHGAFRMMFNTPTWHATGVINDIPNPSRLQDAAGSSYLSRSQSRSGSLGLPDYASRGASANNPDTARALELALREVLDNIKAATSNNIRPRLSPFDFDIQSQTFPSICLLLLPPPPSLFSAHPFPSPGSFPLQPPGVEHLEIVRQALRSKIGQWRSDQLAVEVTNSSHPGKPTLSMDSNMINRTAQQHEEMSSRHLELAFKHWMSLPPDTRRESWQLEITRAFAREVEKRKSLDDQLARVQQEANQLRAQVERLGSCQWPREFALFPPDTLPIPREVAKELDVMESVISPNSPRWDYDSVVAKWKRVVMHDKSMGRVGVGQPRTLADGYGTTDSSKPRPVDDSRLRTLHPPPGLNPNPSSSSIHHNNGVPSSVSPRLPNQGSPPYPNNNNNNNNHDTSNSNRSPRTGGPQAKRPRLINGHVDNSHTAASEPQNHSSPAPASLNVPRDGTSGSSGSTRGSSHSHQSMLVSSLAPPTAPTPPPSNSDA